MRYGSVCSGIEAASVAWDPLGWKPVFFSEIDAFPSSVLKHHWPEVPNLGDMTQFKEWPYGSGSIDLLVGGTPCQSFSLAGLRGGLDDERGNLALVFARMVDHLRPKWVVWENVPGVLSSNGGRDFGAILGAFQDLGYGWAYRVLDAQYFGVPQRRKRVFVVGHIGNWRPAAAILFEPESLRGYSEASRKASKDNPNSPILGSHRGELPKRVAPTLNAAFGKKLGLEDQHALSGAGLFVPAKRYSPISTDGFPDLNSAVDLYNQTLTGNTHVPLRTAQGHGAPAVLQKSGIRRLTPTECERLQGFPDGHTDVPYKGKSSPEGARYKAIGNSMAVPVMRWIGQRINTFETIRLTGV